MSHRYIDVHAHCPPGEWSTWEPRSSLDLLDRLEIQTRISHLAELACRDGEMIGPADIATAIRGLYFETALSGDALPLRAALDLVPASQLLYGTDCGAAQEPTIRANTAGLESYGLSELDMALVRRGNALRLFARLSSRLGE